MKEIQPTSALYPVITTLIGANVAGKPNFLTVAHVGILTHGTPQYLSIGLGKIHYTNEGIKENGTFSICVPSTDLVVQTDYCGLVTGRKTDKALLFDIFYGQLQTAPMILQCPVNMELRLHDVLDYPSHDIMIGELVHTYADERVLHEGSIDVEKLKPLLFDIAGKKYWSLGEVVGDCWSVGKILRERIVSS